MPRLNTHAPSESWIEPDAGGPPLVRAMAAFAALSDAEAAALAALGEGAARRLDARRDLVREGDRPRALFLLREGWACRYKALSDGRRQITAFLLPGEIVDLHAGLVRTLDHSIASITPASVVELDPERVREVLARHPRLVEAFGRRAMVEAAVQREWVLNIGQRSGIERLAHLICELYLRARSLGASGEGGIGFPLTQADLADATGLTPVHVNRMLKELRDEGLVRLRDRTLTIPDLDALKAACLFNDTYLHLGHAPERRGIFPWH